MLSLIIDELNEALGCLWEDDWGYAYHTGKAGGIAGAIGARGLLLGSLCDEIANAYELLDLAAGDSDDFDDFDPEEFTDVSDYIVDREGYFGRGRTLPRVQGLAGGVPFDSSLDCGFIDMHRFEGGQPLLLELADVVVAHACQGRRQNVPLGCRRSAKAS